MGGLRGRRDRTFDFSARDKRDRETFERFCYAEYTRLVDTVGAIISDRDLAAEAVNEALARAWKRMRRGEDLEALGGWVRVVAINFARDQFRRRKRETAYTARIAPASNLEYTKWGVTIDVHAALQTLPPRQREVVVLRYFCDMTVRDIARDLHIAETSVKSSLERGRIALERTLKQTIEEETRDVS